MVVMSGMPRTGALALLVLCGACNGKDYITQEFSFPESIRPHESGWQYRGTVKMWSSGRWYERNSKKVRIYLVDAAGRELQLDDLVLSAGPLRPRVHWRDEHILTIELVEQGSQYVAGEQNAAILKRGPLLLRTLTYDPVTTFGRSA